MSTRAQRSLEPHERPPVSVRRFSVEEYRRLGETGILTENDRVELLEGWIVPKMVHNPPHDNAIELVDEAVRAELPSGWRIRIQSSIRTKDSEPEPDLAVVRGTARSRGDSHPEPQDIGLVVEVADSSLETDRGAKARLYARAKIEIYWIVNLVDECLEVHSDPSGPGRSPRYRKVETLVRGRSAQLVLGSKPIAEIPVGDLLP